MSEPTVLLLSMRSVNDLVASCALYEFEDVVQATTGAERIDATHSPAHELSRRIYKYARRYSGSRAVATSIAPAPRVVRLRRDYDLFLPIFNHTHELYALAQIPEWRKHCRYAACYILELWSHLLPDYLLELLVDFDVIFVGSCHVAEDIERLTGRPCRFLAGGVDVLNFAPYPEAPPRTIDVCNIGRRAPLTHRALFDLMQQRRSFVYYFDTVAASGVDNRQRTYHVDSAAEHRLLFASLLQRSRYYIANRARVNEPDLIFKGDEISNRFYEGAAAGCVMIGEPPRIEEFEREFDWPDAVIPVPFDAPEICALIAELDADPARLARIRRDNVYHAALRHDWAYRLQAVFEALGLAPTRGLIVRERQLRALAAAFKGSERVTPIVSTGVPTLDVEIEPTRAGVRTAAFEAVYRAAT